MYIYYVIRNTFQELSNSRLEFLQHQIASNAVLEWYRWTIRGGNKIYQYCRYDLCQQYEHYFQKAKKCEPFETKPTHMQTKQLPIVCNEKNIVDTHNQSGIELTPVHIKITPKLPAIRQRREFLPTDDDLIELGLSNIEEATTPPKNITEEDQPAPKKIKYFE